MLILSDSLTKGFCALQKTVVATRPGATPIKILHHLKTNPIILDNFKVIVLHVGTNWLSQKSEFSLYLQFVNIISEGKFKEQLHRLNPPPANGSAVAFRDTFQNIIDCIRCRNLEAKILVSAIIPRKWDHDRRHLVRISYNNILKKLADGKSVFFVQSYSPFFDSQRNLKSDLFSYDGLHLSKKGSTVLRTFLCDKIDRAIKNKLV